MYAVNLYRYVDKSGRALIDQSWRDVAEDALRRSGISKLRAAATSADLVASPPEGTADLYDRIMRYLYLDDQVSVWAEKNQLVWNYLEIFTQGLQRAFGILLLRDPVDAVSSFKGFTLHDGNTFLGAAFCHLSAMQTAIRLQNQSRVTVHRFEDWISRPQETVSFHLRRLFLPEGAAASLSQSQRRIVARANRTSRQLSEDEERFVRTICHVESEVFGYGAGTASSRHLCSHDLYRVADGNPYLRHLLFEWEATGRGSDRYPSEYLAIAERG